MGTIYEVNWILKLNDDNPNNYITGKEHTFKKDGMRLYPIDVPLDLVNVNWEAIASCIVKQIAIDKEKTVGIYEILDVYEGEKKALLTEQWRNVLQYTKGSEEITDYSDEHIT